MFHGFEGPCFPVFPGKQRQPFNPSLPFDQAAQERWRAERTSVPEALTDNSTPRLPTTINLIGFVESTKDFTLQKPGQPFFKWPWKSRGTGFGAVLSALQYKPAGLPFSGSSRTLVSVRWGGWVGARRVQSYLSEEVRLEP